MKPAAPKTEPSPSTRLRKVVFGGSQEQARSKPKMKSHQLIVSLHAGMLFTCCCTSFAVPADTPARVDLDRRERMNYSARWKFDEDKIGQPPAGWTAAVTGEGTPAQWQILDGNLADAKPGRKVGVSVRNAGDTANVLLAEGTTAQDFWALKVDVRVTGGADQCAGIIWRAQDQDNYYLGEWNATKKVFHVFVVQEGKRRMLSAAKLDANPAGWHQIEIKHVEDRIMAEFDEENLVVVEDGTFLNAGRVGCCTRADTAAEFDDLRLNADLMPWYKTADPTTRMPAAAKHFVIKMPPGRIAVSSDGNQHDEDDWGATAMTLAIIDAAGLGGKLVHYDFASHLGNNGAKNEAQMIESALGGAKRFKMDPKRFFNDQTQLAEAIANFKKEAEKSTAEDPLWYICAGPMEAPWRCINAVDPAKRKFINCISHSGWNDEHGDTPEMTHKWEDLGALGATLHHITDQNKAHEGDGFNVHTGKWSWLKNPAIPHRQWLYSRNYKTFFDISDTGMVFWLITGGPDGGNEQGGSAETRYLLENRMSKGRVVLADPLNGSTKGKQQGGRFVEGGGWTVAADGDRIIWELPPMPPDGMLEIDVRNFDPPHQVTTPKNNFLGLWGKLFDNLEEKDIPDTDGFELRMGTEPRQFKLEYHSRGIGKVKFWEPLSGPFDPRHVYHIKVQWVDGIVTTWLDDNVWVFDQGCAPNDPIDRFNFLHLGTSPHFGGHATIGPIYSNLKITAFEK